MTQPIESADATADEILAALVALGEDPNASRVQQVRARLGQINLHAMSLDQAIQYAVRPKRRSNLYPPSAVDGALFSWAPGLQEKTVELEVWQGTARQFVQFDNRFCGTGEGESHGYGHYVTTSSKGATRYARYDQFSGKGSTATVYRCMLALDRDRVLNVGDPLDLVRSGHRSPLIEAIGIDLLERMDHGGFSSVIHDLEVRCGSAHAVRQFLHDEWGILALFDHIDGAPTFIVLDASHLSIRERWQWQQIDVDGYPLYSYERVDGPRPGANPDSMELGAAVLNSTYAV